MTKTKEEGREGYLISRLGGIRKVLIFNQKNGMATYSHIGQSMRQASGEPVAWSEKSAHKIAVRQLTRTIRKQEEELAMLREWRQEHREAIGNDS